MPTTFDRVTRELAEDPLTGPRVRVGDECRHIGMKRDLVHALRLRRLSHALRSYPNEWNATFLPHIVLIELENFFQACARLHHQPQRPDDRLVPVTAETRPPRPPQDLAHLRASPAVTL